MSIPIRISEEMYKEAKSVAKAEYRSIPSQIEYWARLGKCALENPDLPVEMIQDILKGKSLGKDSAEPFSFE